MMTDFSYPTTGAAFSPCGKYRYSLFRRFNDDGMGWCNFLMLNPSTADHIQNDPTVERCERRARQWGYSGLKVTNIFAWRSTNPRVLATLRDPIGPRNDHYIIEVAHEASLVVCAWGRDGNIRGRSGAVVKLLRAANIQLTYLKMSENTGEPWHPLYLSYKLEPKVWR